MKTIDLENHFYDYSAMEALGRRKSPPFYNKDTNTMNWTDTITMPMHALLPPLLEVGEKRLEKMDKDGIDLMVLSASPGLEQLEGQDCLDACSKSNEVMYGLTKAFPARYRGSAILPVNDVGAACKELEKCVNEYGFVAWHTHSNFGATAPDDPQYRAIFQKAADLGVYVYLHPQLSQNERMRGYGFSLAGPGLGFTLDTMITIIRLIMSGIFDEIPNLKLVLGHLGEALPFLLDRIDNRVQLVPSPCMKNINPPSYYFKNNIWVTTSGNMSAEAFKCTQDVLGIDRILIGTDYPYEDFTEMVSFIKSRPLNDEDRAKLYYKNAAALGLS